MDRYREPENEWCLPQRTGTRRYSSMLQDLFWRTEHLQSRVDRAANCARRRYDNARRLTPYCSGTALEPKDEKEQRKKERALCRLVRHYGLYLSLYHIMSLSLTCFWNAVLYCTRAISDAPIPLPASSSNAVASLRRGEAKAEDYRQHIYARLHNNCKEFAAPAFERLLIQIDSWITLLDRPVSVESLENTLRIDVVLWTRQNVIATITQCEKNADRAWFLLLNLCDRSRITTLPSDSLREEVATSDDVALKTLERITDSANGGDHIKLISRYATPFQTGAEGENKEEGTVSIALPSMTKTSAKVTAENSESVQSTTANTPQKHRTNELERLESALKAIGG